MDSDSVRHEFQICETPDGITLDYTETEFCQCTWVQVENENGAEAMGKPVGNYVTIESDILLHGQTDDLGEIVKTVSRYLVKMMDITVEDSVLVVGVGNRNIIADSLGVRAADSIMATRHIAHQVEARNGKPIRKVSVITPGVMGVTGISTAEIIKSISDTIKPSLVILIDALAAGKTSRLCSTIQITDTGMTPAAGVLGQGKAQTIDAGFLGIPVIGVGMPTVISAVTIMTDFMSLLSQTHTGREELDAVMVEDINQYANEIFPSSSFVTTKEIDEAIQYSSYVLSTAMNMALFQDDWTQPSHDA